MDYQRAHLQNSRIKDEPLPAEFMVLVDNLRDHFSKQRALRNALTITLNEPTSVRMQLSAINAELDELANTVSQTELRVSVQLKTADNFKHGELQSCSRNIDLIKKLADLQISAFVTSETNQYGARSSLANLSDTNPLKRELDDALFGVYSEALAECERRLIATSSQLATLEEQLVTDWNDIPHALRSSHEQFAANLVFAFGAFTACAARVEQIRAALRDVRERLVSTVHSAYGDAIAQRLAAVTSLSDSHVARTNANANSKANAFAASFLSSDSAASRSVLADLAKRDNDKLASNTPKQFARHPSTMSQRRTESEGVPQMRIQLDGSAAAPTATTTATPTQRNSSANVNPSANLVGPSPFGSGAIRLGSLAGNTATTSVAVSSPFTPLGGSAQPPAKSSTVPTFGTPSNNTPSGGFSFVAPPGAPSAAASSTPASAAAASPFALGAPTARAVEQPQPGTKRAR